MHLINLFREMNPHQILLIFFSIFPFWLFFSVKIINVVSLSSCVNYFEYFTPGYYRENGRSIWGEKEIGDMFYDLTRV